MKINLRKIFVFSVLVICIIAINFCVYFQIVKNTNKTAKKEEIIVDTTELTENFNNIFNNNIDYQNNKATTNKIDNTKELVYTSYNSEEKLDNNYDLKVNIPYLNISNNEAENINVEINDLFYNKAISILNKTSLYTIYTVNYKAYINDNILSLIIRTTLKEGENPQREIIKTYNYNLSSNANLNIKQVLEYRNISEQYAQSKINETIKNASENANKYKELGYSKYLRNVDDDMYKLENTSIYFLGENKSLYILYSYGNLNYTSEVDLLII